MVAQSSSMWRVPGGLGALAELVNSTGGALALAYQEAEEIEELLRLSPAAVDEDFEAVAHGPALEPGAAEYALAPFEQALVLEDGVLVLTRREITHLSGLCAMVWEALRHAGRATEMQLEAHLMDLLGRHPDQVKWLRSALEELVSRRVVRHGREDPPACEIPQSGHLGRSTY